MLELIKLCSCLRTQISRNALGAIQALFFNLKKGMDINIAILIPILIKNAGHTNSFIAEEAEKALIAGCQNCSEQLVINSALSTS